MSTAYYREPSDINPFPHSFIAVEGNIGAGKTTLCKMMEGEFDCRLILEQFTDNPFLPEFYKNPERYAFPVELFFMTERHKQLQEVLSQRELFPQLMLADYYFIKTLLFAKNNLNDEEYRLFKRLFDTLNTAFRKPDLLVYLHRSVPDLVSNIHKRGREIEKDIRPDYLQSLQEAYFGFFRSEKDLPILIIDVTEIDFGAEQSAFEKIMGLMKRSYSKGIHRAAIT
ncbi:MAG: deoxynucleoside kinase [Saprospiraceae bacterium]|nr:deoxynucleoside kinase [Saprospiraceae bacterium]MCF8249231.1 deoxynucleoside kinase [Saprospiraceae bacterium]MCF8311360.1 deoxynucleoside kinase [Saprospiraceae bacterium]MCF8442981.1 deoxynucleoside kinase [Saprospiraceae bacterium]